MPLVVGLAQTLPPLDPTAAFEVGTRLIARQVFDAPFFPEAEGDPRPTPVLFERFEPTSDDGCSFRGTLRELRFSNGAPLEPTEVARTIDSLFGARGRCTLSQGALEFTLARPNPRLDLALSLAPLVARRDADGFVGTARYRVAHASEAEVVLEPNRFHPSPPNSTITFRSYPLSPNGRAEALVRALANREVDVAPTLTWRELAALDRVTKLTRPVNATGSLYFNTERVPLELRRVMAAALDPAPIALAAFGGDGVLQATSLLPTDLAVAPMVQFHSPSSARRALETLARPTRPLRLRLIFTSRSYLPDPLAAAEAIRSRLSSFDLPVTVVPSTSPESYQRAVLEGDYELLLTGNVADGSDPADFLGAILDSHQVPSAATLSTAFNFSRLCSPAMDHALADFTAHRTAAALEAVTKVLRDEVPLVPLTHGRAVTVHQWHVKGLRPSLSGLFELSQARLTTLLPV